MSQPRPGAPLLMYLSVAGKAVSSVLIQEEGKHQHPVYFTSRMLHDAEKRYQMIENVALTLIISARQLRPYFQSHQLVVKTNYPMKQVLRKPELAGRMVAWFVELSEFDIHYEPHDLMKTQLIADFLVEFTWNDITTPNWWTLYVDGAYVKGSGAGIILEVPNNITLEQALKLNFRVSNNQTRHEALIAGLKLAREVRAKRLRCYIESQLVQCFKMYYIPRETNTRANLLSKLANTKKVERLKTIIQETLQTPTIDAEKIMVGEEEEPNWMTLNKNFLIREVLPPNEDDAQCLKWKVNYYVILNGELFKRGLTTPLLKCLNNQQAYYIMKELHKGICGLHTDAP